MLTCEVCGNVSFEYHVGFIYCTECQTQSQDYYEQEYQYTHNAPSKSIKPKKKKSVESIHLDENGIWTSWDAFNYILHGMTKEVINVGGPKNLDLIVLQLWACYLNKCEVAFVSTLNEAVPKLGFLHRSRDARILHNAKNIIPKLKRKSRLSKCSKSEQLLSSRLTGSTKKIMKKIMDNYYEEYSAAQTYDTLRNETLESIGRPANVESISQSDFSNQSLRSLFRENDYTLYKNCKKSPKLISFFKTTERCKIYYLAKNKLLAILQLALLLCNSHIQLSDLMRFIREGHLSFAKVTHFLPEEVKFGKKDSSFIESVSDSVMPTHLNQRKILKSLASFLGVQEIPVPNIPLLISRYCDDLNLPDSISYLSQNIFSLIKLEKKYLLNSRRHLPNFEALAMASILFTMKLLFGLDSKTELILSDFARKMNGINPKEKREKLFVFDDWQKHLECRKTILNDFHYPTEEQLERNTMGSSKNFIQMLCNEDKDEGKKNRFIPYKQYYMNSKLLEGIREIISTLTEKEDYNYIQFPCSLTPQTSYLNVILQLYAEEKNNSELDHKFDFSQFPEINNSAWNILKENFRKYEIDFVFHPETYIKRLKENNFHVLSKSKSELNFIRCNDDGSETGETKETSGKKRKSKNDVRMRKKDEITIAELPSSNNVIFIENCFDYWILDYPTWESKQSSSFNRDVVEKTSRNFQWILSECSRMLEMNRRELYEELLFLEKKLKSKRTEIDVS